MLNALPEGVAYLPARSSAPVAWTAQQLAAAQQQLLAVQQAQQQQQYGRGSPPMPGQGEWSYLQPQPRPALPCPACLWLLRALWLSAAAAAGLPCHWPPARCTCFPLDCRTVPVPHHHSPCVQPALALCPTTSPPCPRPPRRRAGRAEPGLQAHERGGRGAQHGQRQRGAQVGAWCALVGRAWCVVGAEHAARSMGSVSVSGAQVGVVHSGVVWAEVVEAGVLVGDWRVGPGWLRRGQRPRLCSSSLHQQAVGLC